MRIYLLLFALSALVKPLEGQTPLRAAENILMINGSQKFSDHLSSSHDRNKRDAARNKVHDDKIINRNQKKISSLQSQNTSSTISRLIASAEYYYPIPGVGPSHPTDTTVYSYTGTHGGDLLHRMKYSSAIDFYNGDSTLFFQTFDSNDNISSEIRQKWSSFAVSWTNLTSRDFLYDSNNNDTSEIISDWDSVIGVWVNHGKWSLSYDVNNNLISETYFLWDDNLNIWQNASKTTYAYNAADQNTFRLYQSGDTATNSWINSQQLFFYFDSNGNDTLYLSQTWNNSSGVWVNQLFYNYFFDSNNDDTLFIEYYWDTTAVEWINAYKVNVAFDGNHNHLSEFQQRWDISSMNWINSFRDFFQYDSNNNDTTYLLQEWMDPSWNNYERWFSTWNSFNQETSFTDYSWFNGNWEIDPWQFFYYYDTLNLTLQIPVLDSGKHITIYPNPVKDVLHFELTSDHASAEHIILSDVLGEQVWSLDILDSKRIEVLIPTEQLSNGVYFLAMNSSDSKIQSKVIIVH